MSNGGSGSGTFFDLRIVVENVAAEADTDYGQFLKGQSCRKPASHSTPQFKHSGSPGNNRRMYASTQETSNVVQSKPQRTQSLICLLFKRLHVLWKCEKFKEMSVSQRREYVKGQNLCFNCLRTGHRTVSCSLNFSFRTCKRTRFLLHVERVSVETAENPWNLWMDLALAKKESFHGLVFASNTPSGNNICPSFRRTIFQVVPAKIGLTDSSNAVSTYAFIDKGSSVNMFSESFVERLGAKQEKCDEELVVLHKRSHSREENGETFRDSRNC